MLAKIKPLYRAILTLPDGSPVEVERIGKGRYTTAWATVAYGDGSKVVYLQTSEKDASKEVLASLSGKPHLPKIEHLGSFERREYRLYVMPRYRKVTARDTPTAWRQLKELIRLREMAATWAMQRRSITWDGYDLNDCFREALREESHELPEELVESLTELLDAAANYGEYAVEFRRANVAADAAGRLVLLDPLYDVAEVREANRAARQRANRF
jgi:hypothetical protein